MSSGRRIFALITPLLLGVVVITAAPGFASAISDTLTVYSPTGTPVYVLSAPQKAPASGPQDYFFSNPSLANPAMVGKHMLICGQAACGPPAPNVGDILLGVFSVQRDDKTEDLLGFVTFSAAAGTFGGGPVDSAVVMPGKGPINVSQYLSPMLQEEGWKAYFALAPVAAPVAEPGTVLLLGSSLLWTAGMARRRAAR